MPGYKKPMMGHKPKMAHGKKPMMAKKGLAALAAKVPELTYTPKMMKVMGNKGTKNTPLNFKDLDVNNAKAMDYHKKTMMYGKPKSVSGDGKHTGKTVIIDGKKLDTRGSEYKYYMAKAKKEKQAEKAQGANYIGGSKDGKPVTK